ncbi:MAG TPA: MFS transporter, partial [Gemmatimonadales bacterium]|nr:MFS transporter [Gemmatimonadales bacterium]
MRERRRIFVIFLTVLIDLIGFGIVLPILPYVAARHGAGGLGYGLLLGIFSAAQLFGTAILGRLSDRLGRRPVILATTFVNATGYALFAVASSYEALVFARLISGFASGNISVAQAYIADVTPLERRSRAMGTIGAAFGIGFIVGPALGAIAARYGGNLGPGALAGALALINFVVAWAILDESLDQAHRQNSPFFDPSPFRRAFAREKLRPLLVVWLLAPFAFAGWITVLPLDAAERFGWGEREMGALFVLIGVIAAVVQGWLFGKLQRRTGDRALLIAGNAGMALALVVLPLMPSGFALYVWMVPFATSNSFFGPSATGMVSTLAGVAEQGTILGVAQSVGAVGRLAGPEAIGLLHDHVGSVTAILACAAVMALSSV